MLGPSLRMQKKIEYPPGGGYVFGVDNFSYVMYISTRHGN